MRKGFLVASMAVSLLMVTLGASTASADSISMYLKYSNVAPTVTDDADAYAKVTVNRSDSTHATVTITTVGYSGLTMFGEDAFALQVAGAFTTSNLTGFTSPTVGSGTVDGFGTFNLTIKNFDGPTHGNTTFSVNLTRTNGGGWNSAGQVISKAAAHVAFVEGCTGYIGTSPTSSVYTGSEPCEVAQVPEPNSLLLLGSGLLGLLAVTRRRMRLDR